MTPQRRFSRQAALQFLSTAYSPDDWIAVLLKPDGLGEPIQRVGPVEAIASPRFQSWLRAANAAKYHIYVSINAVTPGQRSRRRKAIHAVRHVFLDVDWNMPQVLAEIETRPDLPTPSYILRTSEDHVHVLWRVTDFTVEAAEMLQRHLAGELRTDQAATSSAQMTRLPGFFNHKHDVPPLVTVEYRSPDRTYTPEDFPDVQYVMARPRAGGFVLPSTDHAERARRYLAAVPPATQGQHGDLHTFRMCCRLVRGFALSDADAFSLLAEWNRRCQPPWSEAELRDKLHNARWYGKEPVGGLVEECL
jgi:hypothetical protein